MVNLNKTQEEVILKFRNLLKKHKIDIEANNMTLWDDGKSIVNIEYISTQSDYDSEQELYFVLCENIKYSKSYRTFKNQIIEER